jgi:MFS family permease
MASNPPIASPEPTTTSSQAPSNRSAMIIVFFVVVVDLLGFGIVLPILPVTGKEYIAPLMPHGSEKAVGAVIGLLLACFSAMQFFFAPMWGRLSDRFGRRPILLVGLVGSVVFYGLFGFAAGLPVPDEAMLALVLMFAARIGAGLAGATIATAQAVIADCTPPEKRKHGMAMIGAAFGIAFTFGPMLGALAMYLAPHGRAATSYTGYLSSILSAVALVLAIALLPETRKPGQSPPAQRRLLNFSAWRSALSNSAIAPVILTFFLATIGFGAFESTLALLIKDVLDLDKDKAYWVFAYVGFVLVLTQGFLYRRLAKTLTEVILMTAGIILMSIGVIALAGVNLLKSTNVSGENLLLVALAFALTVAVIGFAFLTPSAQALVSRRTSADKQGEILGVNQSASALARIIGPIFGNTLYSLTDTHMLPYLFGAGLLLLMLPLMPRVKRG